LSSPEPRPLSSPIRREGTRTVAMMRAIMDERLADERDFTDRLLDAVGQAVEDLKHEVGNLRSAGREDDAQAIEDAMRCLTTIASGVDPIG
jgi:hypothetical protein